MTDTPTLQFWFEFGSNYSYLSVMRIEALAKAAGVRVQWRPFLLGPIFKELGWSTSPFVLQKEKGEYAWKDVARQASKYGLPFRRPSVFPRVALLPLRVAVLGSDSDWMVPFCERVMLQNWRDDLEINEEVNVLAALEGLVDDPRAVLAAALTDENKRRLRENTEQARARGIFGAPSFFVGDELFWGNDRLEDALAFARQAHAS
ncbi:2-hydroxychromene-2-carboxylate isomerase [Massilia solisilvae]|uniref:2-hydroxychromene-2-carboxylate isomerase n=1 Tax=Massilia solisilvae TaxID=1811225 RepID=A0ABT2BF23_9BURK|nr:2-hydroxychromene-2-carboxylate isomerase [Massilia solisilvae]MCS0607108.1 2-hydroxychromene-2-carboxylate isomerase [Massilia solisilvae]